MTQSFVPDAAAEDRLARFSALFLKWNGTVNLVSAASVPHLRDRHILDSAQLAALCPPGARLWADLGTGGGFPGLIVAILLAESAPGLAFHLIESDQRKAAFLREAARLFAPNVTVHARRIEDVPSLGADVVSARALAPLPVLLGLAARHLAPGGIGLFLKGAAAAEEIAAARRLWTFEADLRQSRTDPDGVILRTEGLRRAD